MNTKQQQQQLNIDSIIDRLLSVRNATIAYYVSIPEWEIKGL
jgi:hypothetical protein